MKIAIFGDAHLNFKQYGLAQRENDFLHALADITRTWCKANKLKPTIISAGDLFNNSRPSGDIVCEVRELLSGCQFYGIDGNHDISDGSWLRLCDGEVLDRNVVDILTRGVHVAGLSWVRPGIFMETLKAFTATLPANTRIDVFILHQLLDDFISFKQGQITAGGIAEILKPFGVKAVVMGDLHEAVDKEVDGIQFIYTGSIEQLAVDQQADKSYVVLDVTETGVTFERIPIKTRAFVRKFIQSEDDLDALDTSTKNFLILEYDVNNKAVAVRAEKLLKDKCLFKLLPITSKTQEQGVKINSEGFERSEAVKYLKESIDKFFDAGTDEHDLVVQLLEAPDDVERVLVQYGKDKKLI